jgi:thermitase
MLRSTAFAQREDGGRDENGIYWSDSVLVAVFNVNVVPDRSAEQDAAINAIGGEVMWRARTVPGLMAIRVQRGLALASSHLLIVSGFASRAEPANSGGFARASVTPNDPDFSKQWGFFHQPGDEFTCAFPDAPPPPDFTFVGAGEHINAPAAWDIRTHCSNIVVAIVDSGVHYFHPDLINNMWRNPEELNGFSNIDDDPNGIVDDIYGASFQDIEACNIPEAFWPWPQANDPLEWIPTPFLKYHGTQCAYIIGATGDNGIGGTGICWTANIMSVRTTDPTMQQACSAENVQFCIDAATQVGIHNLQAIDYAVAEGAEVINCSWGFANDIVGLDELISAAGHVIFVIAAHNQGGNLDNNPPTVAQKYPCIYNFDNIICVANLAPDGSLDASSNYGVISVDIAAPGTAALAPYPTSIPSLPTQFHYCPNSTCFGGTSAATPHVTGAVSLAWAHFPSHTPQQIINRILTRAKPLPALNGKVQTGALLDLSTLLLP